MSSTAALLLTAIGTVVTLAATLHNIWRSYVDTAMQQASKVSAWSEDGKVILSNQSLQPVFEIIVSSVVINADIEPVDLGEAMELFNRGTYGMKDRGSLIVDPSFRRKIATLMPGIYAVDQPLGDRRTTGIIAYELAFRDSNNRCWQRLADGRLKRRFFKNPLDLYDESSIPSIWSKLQDRRPSR